MVTAISTIVQESRCDIPQIGKDCRHHHNYPKLVLFARVLSSRSPRHLTCTFIWLLFQKVVNANKVPLDDILYIATSQSIYTNSVLGEQDVVPQRHFNYVDLFAMGAEAIPNRKPRSEWHGWETSFKQTLLLRAKGAIRAFFDGYCRGGIFSVICPIDKMITVTYISP